MASLALTPNQTTEVYVSVPGGHPSVRYKRFMDTMGPEGTIPSMLVFRTIQTL